MLFGPKYWICCLLNPRRSHWRSDLFLVSRNTAVKVLLLASVGSSFRKPAKS
jgi:hypothetical protein